MYSIQSIDILFNKKQSIDCFLASCNKKAVLHVRIFFFFSIFATHKKGAKILTKYNFNKMFLRGEGFFGGVYL